MPSTTSILDDYRRIRSIQRRLGTLATDKISKPAIVSEAKLLGLWQHGGLALESDEELNVLLDHLIQDGHGGPTTPMERITASELEPLGPEGHAVHAAVAKARLNVYVLAERRPGLGWLLEDIWTHQRRLIVDETLSEQDQLEDAIAVVRLVDMGEWSFSTGLQGSTYGQEHMKTLEALLLTSPLMEIAPTKFHPDSFTRAQNLMWSRSILRSWLRPGSVKLVTIPIEVSRKTTKAPKRR